MAWMIARLQLFSTLAQWGLPLLWVALGQALGWPRTGYCLALASWSWPFAVLAVEMALLRHVNCGDPAPRARPRQLLRAWLRECVLWVRVFNLRQPFFSRTVADQPAPPDAQGQRGVVLVHGYLCNRGFWNPWLRRLRREGRPFIAVNLEPAFASIDALCLPIEAAVARLEATTGEPPLIVAHSMGGLVVRAWLRHDRRQRGPAAPPRVHHVLSIGSPHHGTWIARWAFSTNGRQMRRHSDWLRELTANEPPHLGRHFTCIYGHCDNVVMPASTALLAGAEAVHLEGTPHVGLAFHASSLQLAWARLGPCRGQHLPQ